LGEKVAIYGNLGKKADSPGKFLEKLENYLGKCFEYFTQPPLKT